MPFHTQFSPISAEATSLASDEISRAVFLFLLEFVIVKLL
jgi:hypothetical protein